MCTETEQRDIQKEMAAYDALPKELQAVFDECPMKVSVYNTMHLPGVVAASRQLSVGEFVRLLKKHLDEEAAHAYQKDLRGV